MKLDQLLNRLQSQSSEIKHEICDEDMVDQTDASKLPSIGPEIINNGIMAIGGCRKCFRTFTDRLQLIHHFVDHFPSIFYSFETQNQSDLMTMDSEFLSKLAEILNEKSEPKSKKLSNDIQQAVKSTNKKASEIVDNNLKSTDSYHMCPHCCLTFSESSTFESHLKTHSSNAFSSPIFKCDQCEIKCNNLYLLEEHRRLHRKICYICGEQFDTLFDLNLHTGEHLGKPYSCKDCGKCFSSRKTLAEHNRSHRVIDEDLIDHSNESNSEVKTTLPKEENQRPKSLLVSNLYFNGLAKDITRRRRYKPSRSKLKRSN